MPVVLSVLPVDEPIEEPLAPLPEVLLSVLVLDEGDELELLEEPVPDAPMLELLGVLLELGDVLLLLEGDVLLELLPDGEAPIVDDEPEDDGEAPVVLLPAAPLLPEVTGALGLALEVLGEVELEEPAVGVLLLVPVPLPLDAPPAPPPVWATAMPPSASAATAASVVSVDLVALMLNSLMELPAKLGDWSEAGTCTGCIKDRVCPCRQGVSGKRPCL